MRLLRIFIVSLLLSMGCCLDLPAKYVPSHGGVDPELSSLVNHYLDLAQDRHINFNNKVTVGFKNINRGNIVGLCTYGLYFREIDIDRNYWNNSTQIEHISLLFHELTHCYCGRDHDHGNGTKYLRTGNVCTVDTGFFSDGCPNSLMFPSIVEDSCELAHYSEYVNEMFDRCNPY